MKKFFKWFIISLSIIIGLLTIVVLVLYSLLTPARLTPLINKYSTEYLNAKVTFDTVRISLFAEFPKVSLKLVNGEVISYALHSSAESQKATPNAVDTLMRFNEFMISLNIRDLMQKEINIERIRISQPNIFGYISPSGKANWDIITLPESSDSPLNLNIDRVAILGPAKIDFISEPDSLTLQTHIGRLFLRGSVTPDMEKLELHRFVCSQVKLNADIGKSNINAFAFIENARVDVSEQRKVFDMNVAGMTSVKIEEQALCDSLALQLDGTLSVDFGKFSTFEFKDFYLTVAQLPEVKLNGEIILNQGEIASDLECKLEGFPLQSVLELIPQEYSDEINKIRTNIKLTLSTRIKGSYEFVGNTRLPEINADFKIPKGYLVYKDSEAKIDNIEVDASFHFNPTDSLKTNVKLKTFNIEAFAIKLNGNLEANDLLNDPNVSFKIDGSANLRELQKFTPDNLGITARGNISFNAEGSFLASRLNLLDISKNDIVANFNADRVFVRIPNENISIVAEKTTLEFNTTKTRTNRNTGKVMRLLSLDLKSDTARIRMPNRETIAVSKLSFDMRTSDGIVTGDTSRVTPMVGNITANTLEYSDRDSTSMRLRGFKSNFQILPSRENRSLPSIRFEMETRGIMAFAQGNRLSTRDANISITATKNESPQMQVRQHTAQGQRTNTRGRGNRRVDDFVGEDVDIRNTELGAILRKWNVTGNIKSRSGRMVSPYFPLRTRLQNLDIAFTTNDVTLQNLDIRTGESRINLTGKIDNIRRALSTGRGLTIDVGIKADTLNINQVLTAATKGGSYSNASEDYKKAVANTQDEDQLENIIQKENEKKEEKPLLIVVPSNISLDVKLDVNHGKYADVTIHKLTGSLILRNRVIQLKDIMVKTSLGEIDLTALYATRSKKDITLGIDLDFKDIQVEDLIKIIPAVDTLVPMLSSFRGVVNSQVAATASLDTNMNIMLPTLNAACRISGKHMVLLDGATFSEIAHTLKFKNQDNNLVENIAVELLIRDNQIEIFPFIMQIDRYKTAISGIHNLDMTFNYHISVLKSPIPFKVGINVSGDLANTDKMKIKIGKARYKDTHLPTYVTVIDNTRINLRKQINSFIQHGIDASRFSRFTVPAIDSSLLENDVVPFSAQDSLILIKEGLIENE